MPRRASGAPPSLPETCVTVQFIEDDIKYKCTSDRIIVAKRERLVEGRTYKVKWKDNKYYDATLLNIETPKEDPDAITAEVVHEFENQTPKKVTDSITAEVVHQLENQTTKEATDATTVEVVHQFENETAKQVPVTSTAEVVHRIENPTTKEALDACTDEVVHLFDTSGNTEFEGGSSFDILEVESSAVPQLLYTLSIAKQVKPSEKVDHDFSDDSSDIDYEVEKVTCSEADYDVSEVDNVITLDTHGVDDEQSVSTRISPQQECKQNSNKDQTRDNKKRKPKRPCPFCDRYMLCTCRLGFVRSQDNYS